MEGFGKSTEQTGKVLSFNANVSNQSLKETIKQDPDDFISQMLDGFELSHDLELDDLISDDLIDEETDELNDELSLEQEAFSMSQEQEKVLLGEELNLEQSLDRCRDLMNQLDQKLSKIHFYLGEIDRTGIC